MKNKFQLSFFALALIIFSFLLQSFSGIQIEKRHYRKGYYVHICHEPKTHSVYTGTPKESSPKQAEEKPAGEIQQRENNPPPSSAEVAPERNIAPVTAPRISNK
jgi:hypothetical protein